VSLPVYYWDERFTTVEAERVLLEAGLKRKRRREAVDRVAAVLILQGFLDHRRATAEVRVPTSAETKDAP
jgi:putative Holliday junction resolvase